MQRNANVTAAVFPIPTCELPSRLVDVEVLLLILVVPELLVALLHDNLHPPCQRRGSQAEGAGGGHGRNEPGSGVRDPQVRCPNKADVHNGSNHADCNGLLFLGLTADTAAPAKDQTVDAIGTDGEDDHGDVAAGGVKGGGRGGEADCGDDLGDCDVPGALVHFARGP